MAKNYKEIASQIGGLVQEKNEAYGDSFGQACKILEVLYPDGIKVNQYRDALHASSTSFFVLQTRRTHSVKVHGEIFAATLFLV